MNFLTKMFSFFVRVFPNHYFHVSVVKGIVHKLEEKNLAFVIPLVLYYF